MTARELRERWSNHRPGLLGARHSYAVLCPLVEQAGQLQLLFEVRAAALQRQPGEVCFPGGCIESGETPVECALRETHEELGIRAPHIEVWGQLDFICNQAGFFLHPVLGMISSPGIEALHPAPAEVAETFTVPLDFFCRTTPERYIYTLEPRVPETFPYDKVGISKNYSWARGHVEVPVWHYDRHTIWGMTARIVESLAGQMPEGSK